jgi:O-antigen ligase
MSAGENFPDEGSRSNQQLPVELIGEGLLVLAVVTSPWIYGSVEDTVRYALCSVLLIASGLLLWPELRDRRLPRGVAIAMAIPAFGLAQLLLRQTIAPILTLESALIGFSMALVWASVDARSASRATHSGRRLAWALLIVCAAESVFAVLQWSSDKTALFGRKNELQTAPFGSFVNHNSFAGLVSLGVPLALAMAIGDVRRSGRLTPRGLGLAGLAAGLAIAVFASGSRGGVIALVCGLMTLASVSGNLLRKRPSHRSWLAPLGLGLAILAGASVALPAPTRARLLNLFSLDGSMGYRIDLVWASVRALAQRPWLGSGLGAFADAAAPFKVGHGDVRSERAESDLVEFAVEGGLGLAACALLFGRFVWQSSRYEMLHGRDRSGRWLRAGALSACATMLFHSLFDFGFRIPSNALAFSVLLGIASAGPASSLRVGWLRSVIVALIGTAALCCAYRSLGAAGEREALRRASPESRLDALQALVDAHPYLDQARRQRGLAWTALAYSHGNYDSLRLERARRDLQAVIEARRQWGEAHADLGWIEYYSGRTSEARARLLTASRLDPTHMGIGLGYAQILAWTGDVSGALMEVSRLRSVTPGWPRRSALALASSWTQNPSLLANIP